MDLFFQEVGERFESSRRAKHGRKRKHAGLIRQQLAKIFIRISMSQLADELG
jgi:hypothetical protein